MSILYEYHRMYEQPLDRVHTRASSNFQQYAVVNLGYQTTHSLFSIEDSPPHGADGNILGAQILCSSSFLFHLVLRSQKERKGAFGRMLRSTVAF